MFERILQLIAGDYNQKQLKKMMPLITRVNDFDTQWNDLTDEQIKAKTQEFKDRYAKGETLDDLLPEAFATVKQACRRMK